MTEQQRRITRPDRMVGDPGMPGSPDDGQSLDATRQQLERLASSAEQSLQAVGREAAEAEARDQVPPGTFHTGRRAVLTFY